MQVKSFQSIKATARQIESAQVTVNGNLVDATALSVLARFGLAEVVGHAEKAQHQKGKAPSIYFLQGRDGFVVEFAQAQAPVKPVSKAVRVTRVKAATAPKDQTEKA